MFITVKIGIISTLSYQSMKLHIFLFVSQVALKITYEKYRWSIFQISHAIES